MTRPKIKSPAMWLAERCHSLKGVTEGCIRDIQDDARYELSNSLITSPSGEFLCSHNVMVAYDKLMQERDQWRACAQELVRTLEPMDATGDAAIAAFEKLTTATSACSPQPESP